jgi:hypothetical protein
MRVDEPRQQDDVAQMMLVARRTLISGTDVCDAIALDRDDAVSDGRRGDWNDPLRSVPDHVPTRQARDVFEP